MKPGSSPKLQKNKKTSCFLIGEDYLLIKCAEILIHNQYTIIGITSPFSKVREWAVENNIPAFKSMDEAESILNEEEIDYLFSIVNSKIIPNKLIDKAKKLAINYHHSPLPKYAGVNATSWAILNGEKSHGVTWHVISEVIDGGDILKQTVFEIDEHETALTLNHKCYQHALTLFNKLITDINNDTLKRSKQDTSQRSYYGLNSKTIGNGLIDWNRPAEDIERQFRALYMGVYDNSLGVLKIKLHDSNYIVSELKICTETSKNAPGTINEINPSFWRVATTTKDIILLKINTLYGVECSFEELINTHHIKAGSSLQFMNPSDFDQFKSISEDVSKNEQFWINKLTSFEPAEVPFINQFTSHEAGTYELVSTYSINNDESGIGTDDFEKTLLTLWLIYLYRLGNKKNLGVALSYSNMNHLNKFGHFFSAEVPFFVQFEDDFSFAQAFTLVCKQLEIIKSKNTFLKDIFYRYQSLAGLSPFIPISIIIEENTNTKADELISDSICILKISLSNQRLEWYVKKFSSHSNNNLLNFIANSAQHFAVLMNAITKDRNSPIKALPLLPPQERQKLLVDWNNTKITYPKEKNIGLLLDESSYQYADEVAIQFEHSCLTYSELNDKVNSLVDYFSEIKVKHQEAIIVFMPRSLEWIISMLAIIKYGAIYVPVVSNTPIKRLELIISDSKAKIVLSNKSLIDKFKESSLAHAQLTNVRQLMKKLPQRVTGNLIPNFSSADIAYILYTSGTTGVPKGVIIKHYSVINLIHEQIRKLNINSKSNVLQFASIGFDASIWEVFSTLIVGGKLCIPSEKTVLLGESLAETINAFNITLATLPPSILQTISVSKINKLETIVTAGESCSRELADLWVNQVCLINAYGPTETTVCATMGIVDQTDDINIGRPIANTQTYILDDNLNLVPEGVIGELYIGGDALAVGYLNQPKLTHQYFIANPFSDNEEDKLYRTRDLVRWLPEGTIEYIGRVDNQIKIRGLRIEPEAIEAQILHHADITQCVVSLQHNDKLEKFIVAYFVSEKKIDLHELRESLREHLPHYMIPNFFVKMNSLPLTINGKIDRKSLPVPDLKCNIHAHDYVPPRTAIEKKLCQLWADLLGVEKVGIHNDFFTIGGNSLLLSQLIIMLRDHFNFEMHFSVILKNPTIEAIAELVSKKFNDVIDEDYNNRFLNDTILIKEIKPLNNRSINRISTSVLLTGATGFLGSHLLKELYLNKNLQIYCLIRAKSDLDAKGLIDKTIERYGFDFSVDERIIPLAGDLSAPQLGLKEDVFISLAKELDEIYHNGAFVHHLYTYEMLKSTNVESTVELLKLAGQFKNKKIHYISTLSALSQFTDPTGYIIENFIPFEAQDPPGNGYNQTKWVSEKLLSAATHRGYSVNIYRPGWILGSTLEGNISINNNHFLSLIEGCVQMNCAPNWDIEFNILPVDFLSRMIVKISSISDFNNKVFNFSNTNRVSWVNIIKFLNSSGHNIKLIDKEDWHHSLQEIGRDNSLFNLLPLYRGLGSNMEGSFNQSKFSYDENVRVALNIFNESYPIINQDTLSKFLYFLKK
ncbi:amino acid adenylation domain-containing protein [Legionella maioricensis]|uniref:Amino acid adenylation domain-containing protein n=1 Tax=Legionella maioricensis TaxID=2896528 RepID=A0A9X2D0K6_9GAMM|nr:amino acid adenylation domain-containing protein [Legionella maioricensis]MCL9684279.1 amino acid adenylation domain-containing protein [Legionella maioricensis]MCL9687145.1 amino acid adenylation domain-containing protein [Legionella maioricensis]